MCYWTLNKFKILKKILECSKHSSEILWNLNSLNFQIISKKSRNSNFYALASNIHSRKINKKSILTTIKCVLKQQQCLEMPTPQDPLRNLKAIKSPREHEEDYVTLPITLNHSAPYPIFNSQSHLVLQVFRVGHTLI